MSQQTTAPHAVAHTEITPKPSWKWPIVTALMAVATILLASGTAGDAVFSMQGATSWFAIPNIVLPAGTTNLVLAVLAVVAALYITVIALRRGAVPTWPVVVAGLALVIAFLSWTVAGNDGASIPVMRLLGGAITFAVPLAFGALSAVVCERSGIINISIEGQMIAGAFAAVILSSAFGNPWLGLISAPIAGVAVAALLAVFAIRYRVDNIIVGVVLNMLAIGLTSFLFSMLFTGGTAYLNQALSLPNLPIPLLVGIPVIGPVLFNQSILVYLVYVLVVVLHVLLFRSRWGLHTRSVGEHPKAADTVGIQVNALRWRNVLLGGALAGMGGAMFTIGMGLAFSKNMVAGNGFIALAAMILGGWRPFGAAMAALLFGFATNLGFIIQTVDAPIPTEVVLMIPYLVTILAVGGFVKSAIAPAAVGKPYP